MTGRAGKAGFAMTVSERILSLMKLRGMSYGDLAHAAGLGKSAVHRYATGQTDKVPTEALERLARALGVTPGYLTGWEPSTPPAGEASPSTLAAHFEGEEFSEEELREIEDFVRFVKSKRRP